MGHSLFICHPRECGDPENQNWIPAFAGMTIRENGNNKVEEMNRCKALRNSGD